MVWWQLGLKAPADAPSRLAPPQRLPSNNRQKSRRYKAEHKVQCGRGYPLRWANARYMARRARCSSQLQRSNRKRRA